MTDFLDLNADDRRAIYTTIGAKIGKSAEVLEKDVWVCWTLDALFTTPSQVTMAFKGGTSLSKIYNAIARFSEDVDVTLDHRDLRPGLDPFTPGLSSRVRKAQTEDMNAAVRAHLTGAVIPHLTQRLTDALPAGYGALEVSADGESVRIYYPSALGTGPADYLSNSVLLEFGGRNMVEPNEIHRVVPYLAAEQPTLTFPTATVTVLRAERTFWEKATLAHAECNKPVFRSSTDRLSRHWYDLYMLADSPIGRNALHDAPLLVDVVKYKSVVYYSAAADYSSCLTGGMRLVPDDAAVEALAADYRAMINNGMFDGDAPTINEIVLRLTTLEEEVNARIPAALAAQ